jgi:DNA-binding transcriptional MerR regulator
MKIDESLSLSLEEVAREVGRLLEQYALLGAQQDNRVAPVPDARTIRYYTTLGLVDRPGIDGRQARYNRRHLLQLVAIKALQAINLPLAEIQSRLYGRSDAELEATLTGLADFWSKRRQPREVKTVVWREIVIEPGVRLMVQDDWKPSLDSESTARNIIAALEMLAGNDQPEKGG